MSTVKERIIGAEPRARRRLVMVVVVVLLIALAVVTWYERRLSASVDGATADVATAGGQIEKLLSYTPASVTSDLDSELDYLTGDFSGEYENLVQTVIAPAALEAGVVTEATVAKSAVIKASASEIEALMFVTVVTTPATATEPRVNGSRLVVELVKDGGDWKIASFDPV